MPRQAALGAAAAAGTLGGDGGRATGADAAQRALTKLEAVDDSDHVELRLWLRLLTTTGLVEKQVRARLRDAFGTTLPRFDVMAALARAPQGQTMSELSSWLLVSNGNVTGIVRRLVAEGLVERSPARGDRRRQVVRLSASGTRAFKRHSRAHERWIREMFAGLTETEMATLQHLLKKTKQYLAR